MLCGPDSATMCLKAFCVLAHEARNGEKNYVLTLNLALTSLLQLCKACRSVPTWCLQAKQASPHRLWKSSDSGLPQEPGGHASKKLSRVAPLRLLGVKRSLPVEHLYRRDELWEKLTMFEFLHVWVERGALDLVLLPEAIKHLTLPPQFDQPIIGITWPAKVQTLTFGCSFNQSMVGVVWPKSLRHLQLGAAFNQPIASVVWQTKLEKLAIGDNFHQPIADVRFPALLLELKFGYSFNQLIIGFVWPTKLKQLAFGHTFNQPMTGVRWPASLLELTFGKNSMLQSREFRGQRN